MQQHEALVQIQQKVLASAPHPQDLAACKRLGIAAQGPAQGFAHVQRLNARAGNPIGKAQPRHFNFG